MSGVPALEVHGLEAAQGDGFVLSVPELALHRGEVLGILGANGAGKTTLLRVLAGLVRPRSGTIVRAPGEVALVFQRPVLLRGSALWNVEVALWRAGVGRRARRRRAQAALAAFGVAGLARREASTLSGGEARRVVLARAFVVEPRVLLLDEPFDDLDAGARERLALDLRRTLASGEVAAALVTHELRQAVALADRLALLDGGRLVQHGPRDLVLRRPATPAAAALVGMTNLLPARAAGRAAGGLLELVLEGGARLLADAASPPAAELVVGIRPEHVKIDAEGDDRGLIGSGRVRELVTDGALLTAWIEWEGLALRTHLLAGRGLGHELKPGDPVRLAVRPEDVHLMPRAR